MSSVSSSKSETNENKAEIDVDALINLVRSVSAEIYPEREETIQRLPLDASLETDFGLDSLSRAELISRIDTYFDSALPDRAMVDASTPRDLLALLYDSGPSSQGVDAAQAQAHAAQVADTEPDHVDGTIALDCETLVEALERHAATTPNRIHTTFLDENLLPDDLTYGDLAAGARAIASGLWRRGIKAGDKVALMLPSDRSYFESFMGVLMAGAVPVPIYPPVRPSQLESHLRRHARILDNAQTRLLITVTEGKLVSQVLGGHVPSLETAATPDELRETSLDLLGVFKASPDQPALIQYTSGSTGDPKGVVLTHRQLLANIRAMGRAIAISERDVFVSWLPLYHDMGLIGAWLGSSLSFGARLVLMSPITFLRKPVSWITAMHRYGGTLSAAPNFAYQMAVDRIDEDAVRDMDLSRWRLAFNGAEPVSASAIEAFSERYGRNGFRPDAMAPVFGLAECSLGLTFPPANRSPVFDRVDADTFAEHRIATPAEPGSNATLTFVACGQPLPEYSLRIVDVHGAELDERHEGRVQFRGPSTTDGYYRNPEATEALFDDGWLDSGDLGYIAQGDLYITRRVKDMIIRGGRNLFPYDLEDAVGDLAGVRKGCVAVFGTLAGSDRDERVVVLAEVRDPKMSPTIETQLREAIQGRAADILGLPADDIVLAPANAVLKTSSGKIRRAACRSAYEDGSLFAKASPVWWQVTRLALSGLPAQLTRVVRRTGRAVWGLWAISCLALAALIAIPLILALPKSLAWPVARWAVRAAVTFAGCTPRVDGHEHIASLVTTPSVIAPNHASYIDWLVVIVAIRSNFGFVAKAELANVPVIGTLLRRLDTHFVERFDARQSVEDAAKIGQAIAGGQTLVVFPEGTFRRAPGLAPFRLGAFQAAVQANAPILPVAINGTRDMLPDRVWLPRPTPLTVSVLAPLVPTGEDWSAAISLRDATRARIGERVDEPLLSFSIRP